MPCCSGHLGWQLNLTSCQWQQQCPESSSDDILMIMVWASAPVEAILCTCNHLLVFAFNRRGELSPMFVLWRWNPYFGASCHCTHERGGVPQQPIHACNGTQLNSTECIATGITGNSSSHKSWTRYLDHLLREANPVREDDVQRVQGTKVGCALV